MESPFPKPKGLRIHTSKALSIALNATANTGVTLDAAELALQSLHVRVAGRAIENGLIRAIKLVLNRRDGGKRVEAAFEEVSAQVSPDGGLNRAVWAASRPGAPASERMVAAHDGASGFL